MINPRDVLLISLKQVLVSNPGDLMITVYVSKGVNFSFEETELYYIEADWKYENTFVITTESTGNTKKITGTDRLLFFFRRFIIFMINMSSEIPPVVNPVNETITLFKCEPQNGELCFESAKIDQIKNKAATKIQRFHKERMSKIEKINRNI